MFVFPASICVYIYSVDRFQRLEESKNAALNRMKDGLMEILKMHNPFELSSLCGVLHLKTQQKGNVSLELIIDYAFGGRTMIEEKIKKVLEAMWEGTLY